MTFSIIDLHWIDIIPMFQQDQWKLLDFGPKVEIGSVLVNLHSNPDFPVEPFKAFLSDRFVEAPKRNHLIVHGATQLASTSLLLAVLDAFKNATNPRKIFQKITIYRDHGDVSELVRRLLNENFTVLGHKALEDDGEWYERIFRKIKPEMKIALDVTFYRMHGRMKVDLVQL